jgi:t-SNARE complex subunit (syntaxin)
MQKLYFCFVQIIEIIDLEARKYNLIKELFSIESETIIDTLERVLKREKDESYEISDEHKKELDNRLDNYAKNPENILDWKDVKNNW